MKLVEVGEFTNRKTTLNDLFKVQVARTSEFGQYFKYLIRKYDPEAAVSDTGKGGTNGMYHSGPGWATKAHASDAANFLGWKSKDDYSMFGPKGFMHTVFQHATPQEIEKYKTKITRMEKAKKEFEAAGGDYDKHDKRVYNAFGSKIS